LYPFFLPTVHAWKDLGKVGIPEMIGVSPWVMVPVIWVVIMLLFFWFEKKKL
jgi:uncharacterized protein